MLVLCLVGFTDCGSGPEQTPPEPALDVADGDAAIGDVAAGDIAIADTITPGDEGVSDPGTLDGGPPEPGPEVSVDAAIDVEVTDPQPPDIPDTTDEPGPPPCGDHAGYFLNHLAGPVFSRCLGCHNQYGLVPEVNKKNGWSIWIGRLPGDPDYLDWNLSMLGSLGSYMADKASQNGLAHQGGTIFEPEGETWQHFKDLHALMGSTEPCEAPPASAVFDEGTLLTPRETYRKASLLLHGALPSAEILDAVDDANLAAHLDGLMEAPAFLDRIEEAFNDLLLTDRFHPNPLSGSALANLPYDEAKGHAYLHRYMFRPCGEFSGLCCAGTGEDPCCDALFPDDPGFCEAGKEASNRSMAAVPLRLVRHVVASGLPFSEILTADYTMANAFVAAIMGLDLSPWEDWNDESDFKPVQVVSTANNVVTTDPIPQAGVLSTHMFLRRYITTRTNLNRMRTRVVLDRFLDIDLEELAEFTVDQNEILPPNPTYEGEVCRICHSAMDPVAGFFMYRNRRGAYSVSDGEGWKKAKLCSSDNVNDVTKCVRDPAYKSEALDLAIEAPLQVLAGHLTSDTRFGLAMVQRLISALLGQEISRLPEDPEDPLYDARVMAWQIQGEQIEVTRQVFEDSGQDLKATIRALLLGPLFRLDQIPAQGDIVDKALSLMGAGGGRLLGPEELDRKIIALTGYPWRIYYTQPPRAQSRLRILWHFPLLYGGIDSKVVVERDREPNGVMSSVSRRMASQMSCLSVPQDFAIVDADTRRFFRHVEADTPVDDEDVEAAVRQDIQGLYLSLLGEEHPPDGPEIEAAYALLVGIKQAGLGRVTEGTEGGNLPSWCHARCDYRFTDFPPGETWHFTCKNVPDELHYENLDAFQPMIGDLSYDIRAWQGLVAALLADYRFLYH